MSDIDRFMATKPRTVIKDKGFEYWLPPTVISFPTLVYPVAHPDHPDGKKRYSICVNLTKDMVVDVLTAVEAHIKKNNLPMPNPFTMDAFKIKPLSSEQFKGDARLHNHFSKYCYSDYMPAIGKKDAESGYLLKILPQDIEKEIYAGCICILNLKIKCMPRGDTFGYSFYPQQIIKVGEGESFGGGPPVLGKGLDMEKYGIKGVKAEEPGAAAPPSTPQREAASPAHNYRVPDEELTGAMEGLLDVN